MLLRALPRALLFRGKLHHRLIDFNMAASISTSSAASSASIVKESASMPPTAGVMPAANADRVFRVTGQPGPPLTEAAATAGELPVSSKSLWIAMHQGEVPRFPQLVGDGGEFDVVVVGAGIVGLSAAYTLSRSGYRVAVVEGSRVASGVTSFSTSKITGQHKAVYHTMSTDNARRYWRMNEAGMAVVQDAVQRYGIDCNLQSKPHSVYVWTDSMVKTLRQEYDATIAAGIPGVELATAATAGIGVAAELPASMGVKARLTFPGQMQLNIYSYCIGLVKALAEREGVTFWEDSRVVNVSASAPHVIETKQGRVTGRYCVLGTHLPILDRSLHFSTCEPYQEYAIAVRMAPGFQVPQGMYINIDHPTRSLRPAGDPDNSVFVVAGCDHKQGDPGKDQRAFYAELEAWTREHFPVQEVVARWMAMDFHAPDGRAYMGKMMRGSDTLLTATGFNKWGLSAGSAASLVFRDHIMKGLPLPSGSAAVLPAASVAAGAGGSGGSGAASTTSAGGANASFSISAGALGDTADWAPYFAGERWDLAKALPGMISEGWHTTKHLVGDKLSHAIGKHRSPADLAPGEGDICHHAGKKVAAFRKDDGTLVACQAQCSHLGCDLMFNRADKTFDCPCHGSRFAFDGKVLHAPAVKDLEPVSIEW